MPRLSQIGAACLAAFGFSSGGAAAVSASYLVVAGGGSGASGIGGGGGAGGLLSGTASLDLATSYTIIVGAGGAGIAATTSYINGNNGSNSSAFGVTAIGGGYGGTYNNVGGNGGSGGGGGTDNKAGGTGTSLQGNAGGTSNNSYPQASGGGGGAGANGGNASGSTAGAGGVGVSSSISGTSTYYAGGGGGSYNGDGSGSVGAGGNGGGTSGGASVASASATANTGGGSGGGGYYSGGGGNTNKGSGNGGSGVVIISYAGAQQFGGGVVTSVGGNTIHTFNTSGTLSPLNSLTASYLIVAGGGGGGSLGGGGGAGGLLSGSGITIDINSTYLVTVGAGGVGATGATAPANYASSGTNSSFSLVSTAAVGGGYGGSDAAQNNGGNGGSGGGVELSTYTAGTGTAGQGYGGGLGYAGPGTPARGGGGGGAGGAGNQGTSGAAGAGGVGVASSISGTSTYYAGGGGGSTNATSGATAGAGGLGGGGAGTNSSTAATSGTANTGGGGGAGGYTNPSYGNGGNGGSGVVIISYPGSTQQMAGGTVTIVGGNVIHTFTSSGYLTPLTYFTNSLRWRLSNSAYLSRTPTVAGNRKTWTWSAWVKRGSLTTFQFLLSTGTAGSTDASIYFTDSDRFKFEDRTATNLSSSAQYRDPAAWYHLVCAIDTTQATASNRVKLYVNGSQITSFDGTVAYPTQNSDLYINNTTLHYMGRRSDGYYFDGYMTGVNFIDGQQLTPNSFGTFNSYGVWQPITYGGSYGTNGFYLPFTNKTSTTTLGYDFSPNGNNWTTNNISLTAGATYDSMTDVPTLTSATAANYCVLNPINIGSASSLSSGNLNFSSTSVSGSVFQSQITSTMGVSSGKWYWEAIATTSAASGPVFGIVKTTQSMSSNPFGSGAGALYVYIASTGNKDNGAGASAYGATYTANDVIGIALDMDAGTIIFYKNNVSQGTAFTGISGTYMPYMISNASGETNAGNFNFGQRPFTYTPPTGYVAINTYNM